MKELTKLELLGVWIEYLEYIKDNNLPSWYKEEFSNFTKWLEDSVN